MAPELEWRGSMKTVIIYHSFSGVTRTIAEHLREAGGGDLLEVRPLQPYSKLTAYTLGGFRARGGKADMVEPAPIDVSAYDMIVIGTPVWAGRPTPVINGAVAALTGAEGKRAVIYATCGTKPGDTLSNLRSALAARGVRVIREFPFSSKNLQDPSNVQALITSIAGEGPAPAPVGE